METKTIQIVGTKENTWTEAIDLVKINKIHISFNSAMRYSIDDVTGKGVMLPLISKNNLYETETILKENFISEYGLHGWTNIYFQSPKDISIVLGLD